MLPHHDHVGVHLLAVLPQLIDEHLIAAVGVVAHDHIHSQPRHVVVGLLSVFRSILFRYLLAYDHGKHIGQRHHAPAVDHPVEHIDYVLRLHAPNYASVAVFGRHHCLVFIAMRDVLHYLLVDLGKDRESSAVAHVVGIIIQREGRADKLRVRSAVNLEPRHTVSGGLVHALCALKVMRPVPLFAGLLLDKCYRFLYIIRCILLNVFLRVPHGRDELEGRYAILPLKALRDKAVAHQ